MSKSVQYGLIAGLILVIISLISSLFFSDSMGEGGFGISSILAILSFVAWIYFMIKAATDRKKDQGQYITFKEGLKESFIVAVVSTVITFLYGVIAKFLLFPELHEKIEQKGLDKAIEKWEEQGMSEEQIETSTEMVTKFQDMGLWMTLPLFIILGFIVALIIAAIIKKNRPEGYQAEVA